MMKKMLLSLALIGTMIFGAQAAEEVKWPVWFAFNDVEDVDVIGWRINWFSGKCDQMTGLDFLGFIGRSTNFNGLQINLLRNDVTDKLAGWQIGCYNSCGQSDLLGLQVGLWNETGTLNGIQAGLVNVAEYGEGFQVGLINRSEDFIGFQVGLLNFIRSSKVPFFPIVNAGF